jgi:hypothetical protein
MYSRPSGSPGHRYGLYSYNSVRVGNSVHSIYMGRSSADYHSTYAPGAEDRVASPNIGKPLVGARVSRSMTEASLTPVVPSSPGISLKPAAASRIITLTSTGDVVGAWKPQPNETSISGGILNLISRRTWAGVPKINPKTDMPVENQPMEVLIAQAKEENKLLKKMSKGHITSSERNRLSYLMRIPKTGENTWANVPKNRGIFTFPGPQTNPSTARIIAPTPASAPQAAAQPPRQEASFGDKVSQEVMRSELSDLKKSYTTLERVVVKNTAVIKRETDNLSRLRSSLKGVKRGTGQYKIITEHAKETNTRIAAAKKQLQTIGDYQDVLRETKGAIKYYEDELAKLKPTPKQRKPKSTRI